MACRGAGIVERKFLNLPRDIVSDSSPHILSKPKQDPVFWSVKDLTAFWGRFIDDVFSLFRGNREQAEWYFQKLNSLYPGQVNFKWEFSETGAIFLNVEVFLNKEKEIFETKYYVKPSNKRLFLNYRSNHPNHTFRSIVYSQALQGVMINSRKEWNLEYLQELREKFLDQGYPLKLVNEEYARALQVDRLDLLFGQKKTRKRQIIAPLVITYSPANPPFRKWIQEELHILHSDSKLKKILPKIDVVTRQGKNIAKKVIRSRHWKSENAQPSIPYLPPGNFKLHNKNCVTCTRMEDGKKAFTSSRTNREYKITRHYTCESSHLVYLVKCDLCKMDYVGQTTQTMRKRHLGHRGEIRSGADGLGRHFLDKHGQGLNLKDDGTFEQEIMQHFKLTIIASVQPNMPWTLSALDKLESKFQKQLMAMDYQGGINLRDETKRKRKAGN